MTEGYGSWWHCGVAAVNVSERGAAAYVEKEEHLHKALEY
jgi:TPP-dependent trihydroxycyclohexane-1,2-dione (THcHDO) dehydratase